MVSPKLLLPMPYHLFLWLHLITSVFFAGRDAETAPILRVGKTLITSISTAECAGETAPTSGAAMTSFLCRLLAFDYVLHFITLVHKEILKVESFSQNTPHLLSSPNIMPSFRKAILQYAFAKSAGVTTTVGAGSASSLFLVLGFKGALHD